MYWLPVCWALFGAGAVQAHDYTREPTEAAVEGMPVGDVHVLRDASGLLTIAEVAEPARAQKFVAQPALQETALGYTRDAVWLRFSVTAPPDASRDVYVEVSVPRALDIRFYDRPDGITWRERRSGMRVPVDAREIHSRQPVFPVHVAAGETATFHARVSSGNALALPVLLWDPHLFHERDTRVDLVNGLQFGAIFLMAIYGLLLFIGTRDATYACFATMLAAFGLYDFSIYQYGLQYLWPHSPDWSMRAPGFFLAWTCVGCGLLITRLLGAQNSMPVFHRAFVVQSALMMLLSVLMLVLEYALVIQLANYLALMLVATSLIACSVALFRGDPSARVLFFAFLFMWLTSFVRIGQVLGLVPIDLLADYSQSWSLMISGLLMAMLLSGKIRGLEQTRIRVQQEILRDQVRARAQLEREVEERTAELRAAKEVAEDVAASKSRFLAQLSHELRTPLHSVLGNASLMQRLSRDEGDLRRLGAIERSGRHLLALIDEVLDFVRGDSGPLTVEALPVALPELLQGVLEEMQPAARGHDIALSLRVDPAVPRSVVLDERRLRQVLLNLLNNGCRHSHGRVVRLAVGCQPLTDGLQRLSFTVDDDGQGVAPADRSSLFEPFWQAAEAERGVGLGLGLPIARQWVQAMGGQLAYAPRQEGGSRFFFSLDVQVSPDVRPALEGESLSASQPATRPLPAELVLPSAGALARLRRAAELGLITDIAEWADDTGRREPAAAAFVAQVRQALARVDLPAIQRLVAG